MRFVMLADRAGVASVKRRVSLSKKHLTFALFSCYNNVIGVCRGLLRQEWNGVACRRFTVVIRVFAVRRRIRQNWRWM